MTEKPTLPVSRGLFFEEYEVGLSFTTAGRTITEADIVGFAGMSGDWNPIHTDAVYSAQNIFGQRVAHGVLILAIATGLAVRLGFMDETVLAFREIDAWKFSLPVFIGDTIHLRLKVTELRAVRRLGGGMVLLEVEVINQEEKIVQHGRWSVLVRSRP